MPGSNLRDCTFVPNPALPSPPGQAVPHFLAAPCSGLSFSGSDSAWFQGLDPVTCPTALGRIPADTYTANWSFSVDPWIHRAGVGIRFSWLGN